VSEKYKVGQEEGLLVLTKIDSSSEYKSESKTNTGFSTTTLYVFTFNITTTIIIVMATTSYRDQ